MKSAHVRCFWKRPLGHRWELGNEGSYHYKRCRECGKVRSLGALKEDRPPVHMDGGDWG